MKTRDLEILLPHRAPMLLLSEVVDYDEQIVIALVHITRDSPFFDAAFSGVPSWVGVEYMAQTIAIWAGYQQRIQGKPVRPAFLLGCRSYVCNTAVFPAGITLELSAKPVYQDDSGIGAFDCVIACTIDNIDIRATAQIKAFRPENPEQFVRPFSTDFKPGNPA
jgi:predicted hotdog family 3-hydroxylacyl-ACP dehydratase